MPRISQAQILVLSSFTSVTGQWLMRRKLIGAPWLFWGERLRQNSGIKHVAQGVLAAPIATASGVVGIGRAAEQDYHRRFPKLPHFNIPYHCDVSEFLKIHRPQASKPVTFLFCGQMILRKGVDLLLIAFERLVAEGADVRLLLVGREAELPRLLNEISTTAKSRVSYEGFQPPENLPKYFGRGDIFILPSRHDGWGVVVNQALAAGMPIITSDAVGAGLDLVENGVNGMCVRANDVEALYAAMSTIVRDPEVITQWGKESRAKASNITPEAGADKWIRVFDRVLSTTGSGES